jgi:hypothetical protein
MPYKLKPNQEPFTIMSGPDEGKSFERGRTYDTAPTGYEKRFDRTDAAPAAKPFPVRPKPGRRAFAPIPETQEKENNE